MAKAIVVQEQTNHCPYSKTHIILMMNQPVNVPKKAEDLLASFQQYAYELLKKQNQEISEALRRRHINTDKVPALEDAYKISFRISSVIPLEPIKEKILQLINEVVYFLKDFHSGILGQSNALFPLYEVEILIGNNIKKIFQLESGKLIIQPSYLKLKFWNNQLSCPDIKYLWNRGKHLDKISPFYRYWWLFNPIGEFRSNLRGMLLFALGKKILKIDKLLIEYGFLEDSERQSQFLRKKIAEKNNVKPNLECLPISTAVIVFLKAMVNEEKLECDLDQILKAQDEETLVRLLALFKNNLTAPNQIEEIISTGILIFKEVIEEEESKVHIKMLGLINVGNYHRVDVALSLNSGYLKHYIDIIPRKTGINATLFGLVNVYTIDDITVKPNFHGAMHLNFETIALERALKELKLLP